jgi:hypothetical protein
LCGFNRKQFFFFFWFFVLGHVCPNQFIRSMSSNDDDVNASNQSITRDTCANKLNRNISQIKCNQPPMTTELQSRMGGLSLPHHHGLSVAFQNYQANSPVPTMGGESNANDTITASNLQFTKPPFLLPAEFYKNLFASAAMFQKQTGGGKSPNRSLTPSPTPMDGGHHHHHHQQQLIPRNLLFSCVDKSSVEDSDGDVDDKENIVEEEKV